MGDNSIRETLERKRARLLAEAEAIARDMAELDRLAAKYDLIVVGPRDGSPTDTPAKPPRVEAGSGSAMPAVAVGTTSTSTKAEPVEATPPQIEEEDHSISISDLAEHYYKDERSRYPHLHFKTRQHYDVLIKRILKDCGDAKVSKLNGEDIQLLYETWSERGIAMSHGLITMLRRLVNFGASELGDKECDRLSVVLHRMRFETARSRSYEQLTADQVRAIRKKAHEMGWHSVALAQALQFETGLQQKDVLGEWIPTTDPGDSEFEWCGKKWVRGMRWSQIDSRLILHHTTTKPRREVAIDLKLATMVMEELERFGDALPQSGPVILHEQTRRPWNTDNFRQKWRAIADACGLPKTVKNMDSRQTRAGSKINGAIHQDVSTDQIRSGEPASEVRH